MVKSICVFLSVIFLVAPVGFAAADQTNDEKLAALLMEGWTFERQMHIDVTNLDRALEIFKEAMALAPDSPEARWRMGEILFKMASQKTEKDQKIKLYTQALDYANQALELKPDSIGGLYWKGCTNARLAQVRGILKAMGHVKEAKKFLQATIDTAPDHRFATLSMTILGVINASTPWPMRDMKKAMKYAQGAVDIDPNLTLGTLDLGKVYIKAKKYDKAREQLNRCLTTKEPTYIWDAELKDWPEARALLKEIEGK